MLRSCGTIFSKELAAAINGFSPAVAVISSISLVVPVELVVCQIFVDWPGETVRPPGEGIIPVLSVSEENGLSWLIMGILKYICDAYSGRNRISESPILLDPDNRSGGSSSLREYRRSVCCRFCHRCGVHRPSYGLLSTGKTVSQPASSSSRVLTDYPGLKFFIVLWPRIQVQVRGTHQRHALPGHRSVPVASRFHPPFRVRSS